MVTSAEIHADGNSLLGATGCVGHEVLRNSLLIFLASYLLLFLGMRLNPTTYDEGLVLTGAMRVAAGQVPHRDFYANYGPAVFFFPAALFKIFGPSVLVARLLYLFIESLIVAATYVIVSYYCRRPSIAYFAAVTILLCIYGQNIVISTTMFPVTLLSVVSAVLLVPLFARNVSRKQLCVAGALAGLSAWYRYDTGLALLGTEVSIMAIAWRLRSDSTSRSLSSLASALWPYLLGFAVLTLPPAIYFIAVSAARPLILDAFVIQSKIFYRYRRTPFPGIHLKTLDDLAIYLPIPTLLLSAFVLLSRRLQRNQDSPANIGEQSKLKEEHGLLITLSLLAFVMFFKGSVRVGFLNVLISLLSSLIILSVLFERRMELHRLARTLVVVLLGFFFFAGAFCAARTTRQLIRQGSVPRRLVSDLFASRRPPQDIEAAWCNFASPLTKDFCFLADDGRVRTIEFIDSHTRPDQRLFVGLSRHDKTYANDNLVYFASQRLPATKWSHFDPGLQSTYPIQSEMVEELRSAVPPYIVLDSEYESVNEPNDSSKSSGVTLLDDFIHSKYKFVESFDEMSIWQLIPPTDAPNESTPVDAK
jgi:hypothetical protein